MEIWKWLRGYMGGGCLHLTQGAHSKALGLRLEHKTVEVEASLPPELILQIIGHVAAEALQSSYNFRALRPLLQAAQVCRVWHQLAEEQCRKIFIKWTGEEEKLQTMSWARSLGLLYNWQNQTQKLSYLLTSQPTQIEFQPLDCHLPIDSPTSYDKIELGGLRVCLLAQCVLAMKTTSFQEKQKFEVVWKEPIVNPEKRLFVSKDQKWIATQHYDKKRKGHQICRFDVRQLKTGRLMGQVQIICSGENQALDLSSVEFDRTKFMFKKGGKVWTRYYDPYFILSNTQKALH